MTNDTMTDDSDTHPHLAAHREWHYQHDGTTAGIPEGGTTVRAITKEEAMEFAAQIWTRPENSERVMDESFAISIADALYETNGEGNPAVIVQIAEQGERASDHPSPLEDFRAIGQLGDDE